MIASQDRSGWFGASDTRFVMGNWQTETFRKWFAEKLGLLRNGVHTRAMSAGTYWEHRIAAGIDEKLTLDRQVKNKKYRLRVNLDAETKTTIFEIKTRGASWKKIPQHYIEQVQVQMWATGKRKAFIVAYTLEAEDYINYFRPLDKSRLEFYEINYDENFIKRYKARLKVLAGYLRKGKLPEGQYENQSHLQAA